jgi:hypothetical protein
MQRGLVALAAVLFRLKECGPKCNRFSPFLIHISSMLADTRETDATESGSRIKLIFCLSHPVFLYFQLANFH